MMELFLNEWAAATIALLSSIAVAFVQTGQQRMGVWFHNPFVPLTAIILFLASIIFLSYSYSWFFLFSFFGFYLVGSILSRILPSGLIQIGYIFGITILIIAFVLTHI